MVVVVVAVVVPFVIILEKSLFSSVSFRINCVCVCVRARARTNTYIHFLVLVLFLDLFRLHYIVLYDSHSASCPPSSPLFYDCLYIIFFHSIVPPSSVYPLHFLLILHLFLHIFLYVPF